MKLGVAKGYLFLVSCFWIYLGDSLHVSCFVVTFQEAFCYMFRVSCYQWYLWESILLSNPLAPVTCFLFPVLVKADRTKKKVQTQVGLNSGPLCSQSELLPLHHRGLLLTIAKLQVLIPSVSCSQFHVF